MEPMRTIIDGVRRRSFEDLAVSVFHTTAGGLPDNVPNSAQWFETYLEGTISGTSTTFGALQTHAPTLCPLAPIGGATP